MCEYESRRVKICVFLPATGAENLIASSHILCTWKGLFVQPCTIKHGVVALALIFAARVAHCRSAMVVSWRKPTKGLLATPLLYLHHEFMISASQALSVEASIAPSPTSVRPSVRPAVVCAVCVDTYLRRAWRALRRLRTTKEGRKDRATIRDD